MTTTLNRIGRADHGRPISYDEFEAGRFEEGHHYELIDGRVYVTYLPDPPEDWAEKWLFFKLFLYSRRYPEVINHVTDKARVFVPSRKRIAIPEPDLAAYHEFPVHLPLGEMRWQDVSPLLVAEVLSRNDPNKDLVRNVKLYLQVPTIKEYWLLDTRIDPERPSMRVHRRQAGKWRIIELDYGDIYTTRLLPDFELLIDPRS